MRQRKGLVNSPARSTDFTPLLFPARDPQFSDRSSDPAPAVQDPPTFLDTSTPLGYPFDTRGPACYTPPVAPKLTERWTPALIIQGSMALSSLAAIIFLAVTSRTVPDVLAAVMIAIISFFFGQQTARPAPPPPE